MERLSDDALVLVIENLQLALDYQYQRLLRASSDDDGCADLEASLVQVDLILGEFTSKYERRASRNGKLTALSEPPRIPL